MTCCLRSLDVTPAHQSRSLVSWQKLSDTFCDLWGGEGMAVVMGQKWAQKSQKATIQPAAEHFKRAFQSLRIAEQERVWERRICFGSLRETEPALMRRE